MNDWKQWDVTVLSNRDHQYYQYRGVVARSKKEAAQVISEKVKDDDSIEICIIVPVVEQKLGVLA